MLKHEKQKKNLKKRKSTIMNCVYKMMEYLLVFVNYPLLKINLVANSNTR
jgi:hypothetical protein